MLCAIAFRIVVTRVENESAASCVDSFVSACKLEMSEDEATTAKKEHKVIIIGAGMAGLSAANHLIKNGMTDFRILEARNRSGGRIVSINLGADKVSFCITIAIVIVLR